MPRQVDQLFHLTLQDNLTPFLDGVKAYLAACKASEGDMPPIPSNLIEVVSGKSAKGLQAAVLSPSREFVDWYAALIAVTKNNPSRP